MAWCRPGLESAAEALRACFAATTWPEPPIGFSRVGKLRPMRQVLRGTIETEQGATPVAVKWYRAAAATDRLRKRIGAFKSERERQVLDTLHAADVFVPEPLIQVSTPDEFLVTRWLDDLRPAPAADVADPETVDAALGLLQAALAAGLEHRDLHGENLAWQGARAVLVDLGRARVSSKAVDPMHITTLARLRLGLLSEARRSVRLRALARWLALHDRRLPSKDMHRIARQVEARARVLRRTFLFGRDRRATRSGRHFVAWQEDTERGIRRNTAEAESVLKQARRWLTELPPSAQSLKGGGRVFRIGHASFPEGLVVKRYAPTGSARLPRALRALRKAEALRNRGLDAPLPLLALSRAAEGSLLVSTYVAGVDLHAWHTDRGPAGYAAQPPALRHAVQRRLGRTLRQLHEAELHHRDLKAPNLMWADGRIVIVDVDGLRRHRSPVAWSRRMQDLSRLDASLGAEQTDRLRVFTAYMGIPPWPRLGRGRLLRRIAKGVRRKRGPAGRPR